jgi:preprotein translocase subunit SecY
MDLRKLFNFIPEVIKPSDKKVDFNTKFKWTLIILGAFFVLANIPLFGLSNNALERFNYLAIILGTDFGSIISLGIGPIVMASIILQLLSGAGIVNIDQSTEEGKKFYSGIQKLLVFFFIIFEAIIFVGMRGLEAIPGFAPLVIFQLILGGLAIFYMDEVTQKWGFGSGISLFIAAGVSWRIFTSAFQIIGQQGTNCLLNFQEQYCSGKFWILIQSVVMRQPTEFLVAFATIAITILIYLAVVWAQSLKVEIPLSMGRVRGYAMKWPLAFFYTGVIPVILTAALVANVQLFAGILDNAAAACSVEGATCGLGSQIASWFGWLGGDFVNGQANSGFAFWVGSNNLLELFLRGAVSLRYILQGITHIIFIVILSTLFAALWVKTAGMDSRAQAEKIAASGLQVAGFRQDTRVVETILDRYILPLTIMGGASIGLLAASTDLLGALVSGTSILLVIMIMFQFYQSIAQQHSVDMNPAMKKFIGG